MSPEALMSFLPVTESGLGQEKNGMEGKGGRADKEEGREKELTKKTEERQGW